MPWPSLSQVVLDNINRDTITGCISVSFLAERRGPHFALLNQTTRAITEQKDHNKASAAVYNARVTQCYFPHLMSVSFAGEVIVKHHPKTKSIKQILLLKFVV